MADKIRICVITADKTLVDEQVSYVNIPTDFGSLGILSGHAPMLCSVGEGNVKCNFSEGGGMLIRVSKGIAEVSDNTVTLMVSYAEVLE